MKLKKVLEFIGDMPVMLYFALNIVLSTILILSGLLAIYSMRTINLMGKATKNALACSAAPQGLTHIKS